MGRYKFMNLVSFWSTSSPLFILKTQWQFQHVSKI